MSPGRSGLQRTGLYFLELIMVLTLIAVFTAVAMAHSASIR